MNKKEKIEKINDFGLQHVEISENTKNTVAELDLMIEGYESRKIISEQEELIDELTAENTRLSGGTKTGTVKVEVEYKNETYFFATPSFQVKQEAFSAEEAQSHTDRFPDFVKRGILIKKEG